MADLARVEKIEKENREYKTNGNVIYLFPNAKEEKVEGLDNKASNATKKPRKKSEVYAYKAEDAKRMAEYFKANEMWLHNLAFTLSCNTARRIGDSLKLTWDNLYNPATGNIRKEMVINEEKTSKFAVVPITKPVIDAINLYLENSKCNPAKNNYSEFVFMQLSGTHRGKVLSERAHLKAIKKASAEIGIEYNVGTHSGRKFFGSTMIKLNPNDTSSALTLQAILNHSDLKTTMRYVGIEKENVESAYDEIGNFFDDYVVGDKEYQMGSAKPVVSFDTNDLRDLLTFAYKLGRATAGEDDIADMNAIMALAESKMKTKK